MLKLNKLAMPIMAALAMSSQVDAQGFSNNANLDDNISSSVKMNPLAPESLLNIKAITVHNLWNTQVPERLKWVMLTV